MAIDLLLGTLLSPGSHSNSREQVGNATSLRVHRISEINLCSNTDRIVYPL